jgi:hypothetical protein
VFTEKGYHKATTKEIARAASISEGTIYNYFNNKRELLVWDRTACFSLCGWTDGGWKLNQLTINNEQLTNRARKILYFNCLV